MKSIGRDLSVQFEHLLTSAELVSEYNVEIPKANIGLESGQSTVPVTQTPSCWHYDRKSLLDLAHARLDRAFSPARDFKSQQPVELVKLAGISWPKAQPDELAASSVLARVLQLVQMKCVRGDTGQASAALRELGRVLCEQSHSPIEYEGQLPRINLIPSTPSSPDGPSPSNNGGKKHTGTCTST